MNDFVNIDYVLSFPGMIFICWLFVQAFKNLIDRTIPDNETMWVVLIVAIILVAVKTLVQAKEILTFQSILISILLWIINSVVVWFATLKAHELIVEPITKK